MFIYHFNRMIRSRILWVIFAIVIAVAFLSVDSCHRNPSGGQDIQSANSAGTIGGEEVSYDEYDFTKRILENTTANLSPAATETQIWAHIAAMRAARDMGITASRQELVDRIVSAPEFQTQGVFDRNRYEQMVRNALGFSVQTYERMQAEYIILFKLMSTVSAGATASPMAIDDELAQYTDTFSFRVATIADTHSREDVDVTDSDIEDYYNRNIANYELPDRVSVRFAALPATNFTNAVTFEDLEGDIQDYYESDPSRYTRRGTNGVEQLTLEEAHDQIAEELRTREALHIATTNLVALAESLGDASPENFAWRAKAVGLTTRDSPLFPYDTGFIPGVEAAAIDEFRSEASDLDSTRPDSLYAIARGKRNAYIMRIITNDLAHTQPLSEVTNSIRPLVAAEKRIALFDADTARIYDAIKASVTASTNGFAAAFAEACSSQSLPISTNMTFCAASGTPPAIDNSREVIPALFRMKAGDISNPVKAGDKALIICLESRETDEKQDAAFEIASTREGISSQRSQTTASLFFSDWLIWNLKQRGFTSRLLSNLGTAVEYPED